MLEKIKQLTEATEISSNSKNIFISFQNEIKRLLNNDSIPLTRQGLLELANKKNDSLKSFLDINLSKKSNKAIDLLCSYRFDIQGGYKGYKSTIDSVKQSFIEDIDYILDSNLPESLILGYDPDTDQTFNISQINTRFTIEKRNGFDDKLLPHALEEQDLIENGFIELTKKESDLLTSVYSLFSLTLDKGYDNDYGFGNIDNDITFIKNNFGLNIVNSNDFCFSNNHYFSFSNNDRPYLVLVVTRPSNNKLLEIKEQLSNYQ